MSYSLIINYKNKLKMKKITLSILTITLLLINPAYIKAENKPTKIENAADAEKLINRLTEINELDKSNLKNAEKRVLRKEVKSIKKQLRENSGGIYLSVGAIIIIILLLIILL